MHAKIRERVEKADVGPSKLQTQSSGSNATPQLKGQWTVMRLRLYVVLWGDETAEGRRE